MFYVFIWLATTFTSFSRRGRNLEICSAAEIKAPPSTTSQMMAPVFVLVSNCFFKLCKEFMAINKHHHQETWQYPALQSMQEA
jgi:hypothetical protein